MSTPLPPDSPNTDDVTGSIPVGNTAPGGTTTANAAAENIAPGSTSSGSTSSGNAAPGNTFLGNTGTGAILEVDGVSKRFGGVLALDDVSFSLAPGDIHALVGENGAGKSTLIKIITGVYRPDSGTVSFEGSPVHFNGPADAAAAGLSTIYQEVNLIPLQSVARNIYLGREPRNRLGLIDFTRMNADAVQLLHEYGVATDVRRPLRTLGLGMQQMVALARAVSVQARVVIMDEPTSSLEPREVATLFSVIRRLHEQGVAIVYVSHKMDELYQICQQVTVLRDGKLVHTGDLAELERLQLISMMLGRDMTGGRNDPRKRAGVTGDPGTTAGTQGVASADGTDGPVALLSADGLTSAHLLHDITFDVKAGEVVGLGGLLGSGRTETAKAIAGALPLESGSVSVSGHRLKHLSTSATLRAGIALLTEDRKAEGVIANLSVRENIVLAALPRLSRFGLVSRGKQDALVDTFIKRLRIKASSPEQRVSELSGGNQQKVLLARWLCTEPTVLLLDEPTRGIDVGAKAEVQALIAELAGQGLGVVLISSELEELLAGADRVVVLREGAVAGLLSGDEVTDSNLMAMLADDSADPVVAGAGADAADVAAATRSVGP